MEIYQSLYVNFPKGVEGDRSNLISSPRMLVNAMIMSIPSRWKSDYIVVLSYWSKCVVQ